MKQFLVVFLAGVLAGYSLTDLVKNRDIKLLANALYELSSENDNLRYQYEQCKVLHVGNK